MALAAAVSAALAEELEAASPLLEEELAPALALLLAFSLSFLFFLLTLLSNELWSALVLLQAFRTSAIASWMALMRSEESVITSEKGK